MVNENGFKYSPWLDTETFLELTRDVWVIAPAVPSMIKQAHPAAFPSSLPERLIRLYAFPGAKVLDPFAGSGSTGQAAKDLGCSAVLLDIDSSYCELMQSRLLNQPSLFRETA
jgi:site-specific DNA-methyltransferase (adenine-specific)